MRWQSISQIGSSLAEDAKRLLSALGAQPRATVLTNDWHERSCYAIRDLWGTPVWAPAAGLPERGGELDGRPDHVYEEGTALPAGLRAFKIEAAWAGEHVLLWRALTGEGVLFTGDAINGQLPEQHPEPDNWRRAPGLYLGVPPFYILWLTDPAQLQASLKRAMVEPFEVICGSHARPYRDHPREALAQLLSQDWTATILAGNRPAVYPALLEASDYGRKTSWPLQVRRRT
jgi:glyoxylase-like metal-dependent hydrolase (beta-lactamase superfamily II)